MRRFPVVARALLTGREGSIKHPKIGQRRLPEFLIRVKDGVRFFCSEVVLPLGAVALFVAGAVYVIYVFLLCFLP